MRILLIAVIQLFSSSIYSQIPNGYYNGTDTLIGNSLKVALHNIIKGHTEKQNVNFKDHRTHHEDIITNLYDNIQGTIHKMTAQHSASIARDPMSHESQEKMRYMNTLHDFGNKTLEGSMQDLDKK